MIEVTGTYSSEKGERGTQRCTYVIFSSCKEGGTAPLDLKVSIAAVFNGRRD